MTVNEGAGNALVTVARSVPTTETMTVDYATSNGTATANDYMAQRNAHLRSAGRRPDVLRPDHQRQLDEFDETFNVTLTDRAADGHSELGDGQAVVTITDDEATPPSRSTT